MALLVVGGASNVTAIFFRDANGCLLTQGVHNSLTKLEDVSGRLVLL